jgi:uncharacterized protein (TIGR02099 family)
MRIQYRHLLRALEIFAWAAFFAFAIVFLASRYWLLPNIERYREDILGAITRTVGLPVKIGALNADWQGLRPRLTVTDVRVYDKEGREALVLPLVENVVAWRSLLVGDLRLHSSVIDGPKLAVRREQGGEIYVAGIRVSGAGGDGKVADWILSQDQISVRGAEIEWLDNARGAPPLTLSQLNLRLDNDGDEHAIGINARPPAALGPWVEIRALLEGDTVREVEKWSGRIYAELGNTNLAGWRAWVDYPIQLRTGEGALRMWSTFASGKLTHATADLVLSNVTVQLARELPELQVSAVAGRVFGRQTKRGYDFGARSLSMTRAGAPPMNGTSFRVVWDPAEGATPAHGLVDANLVELGPLAHLAEYLPFPADLRRLLAELAPQGNLLDARVEWNGELPDRATYTARTRFAGLTMKAWRSIPGFANLSGSVEANEKKGTLHLASRRSEVDLPKVFPEPRIALDALSGEVGWERTAQGGVNVRLANLSYANEDLAGTANGTYGWDGEGRGVIDLTAQASRADGKATARYLPLSTIMGAKAREWVAAGVIAGRATDARLRLKGDLRDFPFVDPSKGQFQVNAKVSGAVLDYAAGWPRIEAIEGNLLFDRDKIEIVGNSGTIMGVRIANVRVTLPSMLDPEPRLVIDGGAEGPTAQFLDYIRDSPVRRMVGGFTDAMAASGRGKLRLRLELMLNAMDRSKVAGEYQFAGNNVTFDPRLPPVERAGGRISFTENSLTVTDVRGQLFGGDVRIAGGSQKEAGVQISADGRATIDGLRPLIDHPWRRRLAGAMRYAAVVTVKEGRSQLVVDSSMEGVASALPPPLAKAAPEVLPLRIEVLPGEGRDRISVALGPATGRIVAAEILRAAQPGAAPGAAPAMQVQRTLVTLNPVPGENTRIPERRGTTLRGSLPALDLDRWLPLVAESGNVAGAPGTGDGAGYDVRIGVLDALGKRMRSVLLQGVADASGWSASISTAEFAGDVVYRTEGNGRLVGRFSRFTMPEDAPTVRPAGAADPSSSPLKDLPAVDLVVDSFTHRGRKLGRVEVQARHEGRDWRIDKLAITNPDAALAGAGLWKSGDASRTSLGFKLDVSDVGAFLDRVGYPEHLKGGRAKLEGSLNWNGDPVTLDYATLGGQLKLQVDDGQFLEIEPGIGKLVSLMSLQMLPRRITMDFRDVFSKGFQFDRINSNMAIERGVMSVKEFHMRGPAADVTMNGQIDLSLETQNLNVKVIPQLGDTASTVVGLVHPIAGVATLIAGRIMKNPLGKAFAFDYGITGTWTDPKVEKLQTSAPLNAPADPGAAGDRDIYERKTN